MVLLRVAVLDRFYYIFKILLTCRNVIKIGKQSAPNNSISTNLYFSSSFLSVSKGLDKQKSFQRIIVNIFLRINFNRCFGCSKEPSHQDGSFEYPQHMFWLRNKETSFSLHTLH